jgi:hypothetical protein
MFLASASDSADLFSRLLLRLAACGVLRGTAHFLLSSSSSSASGVAVRSLISRLLLRLLLLRAPLRTSLLLLCIAASPSHDRRVRTNENIQLAQTL